MNLCQQLLGFIEQIGGKGIAFYCLDLFPFTKYEFFEVKNIYIYSGTFRVGHLVNLGTCLT